MQSVRSTWPVFNSTMQHEDSKVSNRRQQEQHEDSNVIRQEVVMHVKTTENLAKNTCTITQSSDQP